MRFQRVVLALAACLFLLLFADAVRIETAELRRPSRKGPAERLLLAASRSEDTLNEKLAFRYGFYECAGLFNRLIGRRHVDNLYRLETGHLVSVGGDTDFSICVQGMAGLLETCSEKGVPLLYVNAPAKIIRDEDLAMFGVTDRTERRAGRFLSELEQAGIPTLDLRPYLIARYDDPRDAFYRTDHHWRIPAALYCARVLSGQLAERFGLPLAVRNTDEENFSVTLMKDCWVGERGKKTGAAYSGLDDFELVKPVSETHFRLEIPGRNLDAAGDFSVMLDEARLDTDYWGRRYGPSFYYAYLFANDPIQIIRNEDQPEGDILIIKDSSAQALNPFLVMTAHRLVSWDVRYNTGSLREYILQNDFDAVVVLYSESTITGRRGDHFGFDFR